MLRLARNSCNSHATDSATVLNRMADKIQGEPRPSGLPESDKEIFDQVSTYHATRCAASPIYAFLFIDRVRLVHASRGLVVFRLTLDDVHLNSAGGLHGSVSATIVDWAGGLAIAAWGSKRESTGVSVDINVTYLSIAQLGDEIEIEAKTERVGGNLAFTSVGIWRVAKHGQGREDAVALGRHTKFVRGSK